jgi:hypothetical protein
MMKMNWIVNAQGCLIVAWKLNTKESEEQTCDSTQDDSHLRCVKKQMHAMDDCIHKQCA